MRKYITHILLAFGLLFFSGCSALSSLFGISFGVLFLIWIVPSLIPAMIASNKGRSGLGLFLLSIFFTPIVGLIVALILAPINKISGSEQEEHIANDILQSQPNTYSTTFKQDEIDRETIYWYIWLAVFFIIVLFVIIRNL